MAIKRAKRFVCDYRCENCGNTMLETEYESIGLAAPKDPETSKFFHFGSNPYYECPFCEAKHRLYWVNAGKLDIGPIYL